MATAEEGSEQTVNTLTQFTEDYVPIQKIVIGLQLCTIVFLLGFIVLQLFRQPQPVYFQANANKQLIDPVSLDQIALPVPALLNWTTEAMMNAFSFNYKTISKHGPKLEAYFNEEGFQSFLEAISQNSYMQRVFKEKLVVSAVPIEAPEILRDGQFKGRYVWQIKMPLHLIYRNALITARQSIDVEVFVTRVPETESAIGLKIMKMKIKITSDVRDVPQNTSVF